MKKISGLLIRDLYLNRKLFFVMLIILAGFWYEITGTNQLVGNEYVFQINFCMFMYVFVISVFGEQITKINLNDKWFRYILAGPVQMETIIKENYLIDLLFLAFGSFTAMLFVIANMLFNHKVMKIGYFAGILVACTLVLVNGAIQKFLFFKVGKKMADLVTGILIMIFFVAVFGVMLCNEISFNSSDGQIIIMEIEHFVFSYKLLAVAIVAGLLMGVSYVGSVKLSS